MIATAVVALGSGSSQASSVTRITFCDCALCIHDTTVIITFVSQPQPPDKQWRNVGGNCRDRNGAFWLQGTVRSPLACQLDVSSPSCTTENKKAFQDSPGKV